MSTLDTTVKDTQTKTIDPVCGMEVEAERTKLVSVREGHSYWFCAEGCQKAFEANPQKYLKKSSNKSKGLWRRYLNRLNRTTKGNPPKCH